VTDYKLETRNLYKQYPGTLALDGVSIGFRAGEVHALVGKNGAGKSTLVRVLAGATRPTRGEVYVNGQAVALRSPNHAHQLGIATVYQDLSLVPEFTVAENILLGRMPKHWAGLAVDWHEGRRLARALLARLNIDLDVRKKVSELGVAAQQLVEIAKAMAWDPAALILDEPTSALAQEETDKLFGAVRHLAGEGVAVVYISHRLQELPAIADRVSVLRDGVLVGAAKAAEATPRWLGEMMFGAAAQPRRPQLPRPGDKPVLEVAGLCREHGFHDVCLTLYEGEILGIAGMVGSGRTELLRAIAGADGFDAGNVAVEGRRVAKPTPPRMKGLGVGLAPEDRQSQGLVRVLSTSDNVCMASLDRIARFGMVWPGLQRAFVAPLVRRLGIAVADIRARVSALSGGNQQKVVIAKWLNARPRIMLFDEPTRGIDVQAKEQIFQIMWDLSRDGVSSVFVSSELEELLEVCHRIVVLRNGTVAGEVVPDEVSAKRLLQLCMEETPARPEEAPNR